MACELASAEPVEKFIREATQLRYPRALTEPQQIAEMLLAREFLRRPTFGVSLETLGLVSLTFPAIQPLLAPQLWKHRGGTDQTWRDFLKICIDYFIRSSSCVSIRS